MRGIFIVGVALLFWINSGHSNVIITEVAMKANPDWVEIYNAGSFSIDISRFMLTDLDGADSTLATASVTLLPNSHAVIHWSAGQDETDDAGDLYPQNGYIDLYVDDTDFTGTDDQAALHDGAAYIDAVIWTNGDGGGSRSELQDFNDLAQEWWDYPDAASWTGYDTCAWSDTDDMSATESLARYIGAEGGYCDTNRKTDWYKAASPTPGGRNGFLLPVRTGDTETPSGFSLDQNHPNPFNSTTTIRYTLSGGEWKSENGERRALYHITFIIYNTIGRKVRTLVNEHNEPGEYTVTWEGRDENNLEVPSGIYFYQFVVDNGQWAEVKKMLLLQ